MTRIDVMVEIITGVVAPQTANFQQFSSFENFIQNIVVNCSLATVHVLDENIQHFLCDLRRKNDADHRLAKTSFEECGEVLKGD